MDQLFNVSSAPHVRSKVTTQKIMMDVLIAMVPMMIFSIYNFGFRALVLIAVTTAAAVLSEYVYEKLLKLPITISDCSAAVTGVLLALNMPVNFPIWMAIVGAIFGIIVVKQFFGGIGQNFMNPALGARCFLLICFPVRMTAWVLDGVTTATPLTALKAGESVSLLTTFLGTHAGTLGETSTLMILIGLVYLLVRRIISIRIPLAYVLSFAIFTLLFSGHGFDMNFVLCEVCSGGLMMGAVFMATDYVTSPITSKGQIIFGILLGVLTGCFRFFSNSNEGVSYAIIFCNLLVYFLDKYTLPVAFGKEGLKK